MKKKTLIMSVVMLFAVMSLALPAVYANHGGGGKSCPMSGGQGGYDRGEGLDKMFFMKSHFILENRDELGLTEDKITEIKNLKTDTLKSQLSALILNPLCINILWILRQ